VPTALRYDGIESLARTTAVKHAPRPAPNRMLGVASGASPSGDVHVACGNRIAGVAPSRSRLSRVRSGTTVHGRGNSNYFHNDQIDLLTARYDRSVYVVKLQSDGEPALAESPL
jgi:hypothetical protein